MNKKRGKQVFYFWDDILVIFRSQMVVWLKKSDLPSCVTE